MFGALSIWLVLQIAAGSVEPSWKIELSKSEDLATMTTVEGVMTITLSSESGIGKAKLRRPDLPWPREVRLRLQLKDLEGFEMSSEFFHFATFRKNEGEVAFWKTGESESQGDPAAGRFKVSITRRDGWVELVVPAQMLEGKTREIEFKWVDYYR